MDPVKVVVLEMMILFCLFTDLKYGLIPNIITIPGILTGLYFSASRGNIAGSLIGIAVTFIVFITMYAVGFMAAGDVKFMLAVSALMGEKISYMAVPLVILSGIMISIAILISKGTFTAVLKATWNDMRYRITRFMYERKISLEKPGIDAKTYIPYMPSIALGVNLALFISSKI